MSAIDKPQKINIGFHGGQVLSLRVKPSELTRLREQLGGNAAWHQLASEDATVILDLRRIDYLLVAVDEHRVGF